jgi:hypothetical protein
MGMRPAGRGQKKKKCPTCHADKEDGVRHAHCAECGVLLSSGAVHRVPCGLSPGQWCPKCNRLLASGTWCPEHGNPKQHLTTEKEGAPK